ncbi:hypothetical protein BDV93DRAFT_565948 [Ceratobasidium sp. AG-I]|nr:hypothetical protein BDV93DRAFT_565948 [Ceratobasidium sp. AG-I]
MPPRHRQRGSKSATDTPRSTSEPMGLRSHAVSPEPAASATSEPHRNRTVIEIDMESPFIDALAAESDADADTDADSNSEPVEPTPTPVNTPALPAEDEETPSKQEPPNVASKPVGQPQPAIEPGSLAAAIKAGQEKAAESIGKGSALVTFLTKHIKNPRSLLERAMNDLRVSRWVCWIAQARYTAEHGTWQSYGQANVHSLQWKHDSHDKPVGSNSTMLMGFIGKVLSDGSTMGPDGGWQASWGREKLHKQKRTFRIGAPGLENNVPPAFWESQWEGARLIVENARKLSGGGIGTMGNCFVEPDLGTIRVRTPIFEPLTLGGEEGDSPDLPLEPEEDTPSSHRYATWALSEDSRDAFDRVTARGYEPQTSEVYSCRHKLIHPNNVPAHLTGAIVLVYCTLERAIFNSKGIMKGRSPPEWQFFANLVKVQVLKQPSPAKSILSIKRKDIHGYGPDDYSGSDSSGSAGPSTRSAVRKRVVMAVSVD